MDRILIKNGLVYDPASNEKAVRDIAIAQGRLVDPASIESDVVIDAKACLVLPGLIDAHTHVLMKTPTWRSMPTASACPMA